MEFLRSTGKTNGLGFGGMGMHGLVRSGERRTARSGAGLRPVFNGRTQGPDVLCGFSRSLVRSPRGEFFCRVRPERPFFQLEQYGAVRQRDDGMPDVGRELDTDVHTAAALVFFRAEPDDAFDRARAVEQDEREKPADCDQVLGLRVERMAMRANITAGGYRIEQPLAVLVMAAMNIQVLPLSNRLPCLVHQRVEKP